MTENPFAFARFGDEYCRSQNGMSLRDYFAAVALQSLIGIPDSVFTDACEFAKASYDFADAMIQEREKYNTQGNQ